MPASIGGRFHGSLWSHAVLMSFLKLEDERVSEESSSSQPDNSLEDLTSSTFARLANVIHDTLMQDDHGKNVGHTVTFAAQDDLWASEWRKRTGVPLAEFRSKWEALPLCPSKSSLSAARPSKAGELNSPQETFRGDAFYGCKRGLSRSQARAIIAHLCYTWLDSFPGPREAANNHSIFNRVHELIRGDPMSDGLIMMTQEWVAFRLGLMRLATNYKNMLGLDLPDCELFDVYKWERENGGKGQKQISYSAEINKLQLFPRVSDSSQGRHDNKGSHYLAIALVESSMTEVEVDKALAKLAASKSPCSFCVFAMPNVLLIYPT